MTLFTIESERQSFADEAAAALVSFPCHLRQTQLVQVKQQLRAGDKQFSALYDRLIDDAEQAMHSGPFSVMQKNQVPPSGDKHDYMSIGPYWWPDPSKPDGLPYIRRDGEVNPEYRSKDLDNTVFSQMVDAVRTLSLAYYFSGREEYASRAGLLLRVWFIDSATRMNPNLEFGQAIPGRVKGRGIGIIETRSLIDMVNSIELMSSSRSWSTADQSSLLKWCSDYLKWLRNSKNGVEEANTSNNHATWYDAQVVRLALFTGDLKLAEKVLSQVRVRRILHQIEPDGRQPHELARTKSFSYSVMNLKGMFELASLAELMQIDLWAARSDDQRGLQVALDYLAPYADPEKPWPHPQIASSERSTLYPLLCQGARHYGDASYVRAIGKLPATEMKENRSRLLYQP